MQLDTGQPLRRVQITARPSGGGTSQSVMTDTDGRFAFTALPAGSYALAAARGGYVTIEHGQRRPLEPGRPVVIADAQTLENVNFSLPRGSVITGRVVDEVGEAVTGATVQVHRYRYVNGQRQLSVAGSGAPTDDRGQFRIFGLLPGDYYISAAPPGDTLAALAALASSGGVGNIALPAAGAQTGYIRTYYPDTPWPASAQRITLRVGEESPLLTLQLVAGRTATAVAGRVADARGAATSDFVVLLYADQRARWTAGTRFVRTARPDQDGRYQIRGLPAGRYLAVALQYLEPGEEFDPERLELFARSATRLELRDGETRPLDLRLSDF